eukprot:403363622
MSKKLSTIKEDSITSHRPSNIQSLTSAILENPLYSPESFSFANEVIEILLDKFEHEIFVKQTMLKLKPYASKFACMAALSLVNTTMNKNYDLKHDDYLLLNEDPEEPTPLGLDPLMPGFLQLKKNREIAAEESKILTNLSSNQLSSKKSIVSKRSLTFKKQSLTINDNKDLKPSKLSPRSLLIKDNFNPPAKKLELIQNLDLTDQTSQAREFLVRIQERKRLELEDKQKEEEKLAQEKKQANSYQAKITANQQVTYDFNGNAVLVKQVNPQKLRVLDGSHEILQFNIIEPKLQINFKNSKKKEDQIPIKIQDSLMQSQTSKFDMNEKLASVYNQDLMANLKPQYGVSIVQDQKSPSTLSNKNQQQNSISKGSYLENPDIIGKKMTKGHYASVRSQGVYLSNLDKSRSVQQTLVNQSLNASDEEINFQLNHSLIHLNNDISFVESTMNNNLSKANSFYDDQGSQSKFKLRNRLTKDHSVISSNQNSKLMLFEDDRVNQTQISSKLNIYSKSQLRNPNFDIGALNQQSNKTLLPHLHNRSKILLPNIINTRSKDDNSREYGGRDSSLNTMPQSLNASIAIKDKYKRPFDTIKRFKMNQSMLNSSNVSLHRINDGTGDQLDLSFQNITNQKIALNNERDRANSSFMLKPKDNLPQFNKARYSMPKVKQYQLHDMQQIVNEKDRFNQAIINSKKRQRLLPQKQYETSIQSKASLLDNIDVKFV